MCRFFDGQPVKIEETPSTKADVQKSEEKNQDPVAKRAANLARVESYLWNGNETPAQAPKPATESHTEQTSVTAGGCFI